MGQIGEGEVGASTVGVKRQFGRPWGFSLCLSSSPGQGSQVPQHTTGLSLRLSFCLFQCVLVYFSRTLCKALRPLSFNLAASGCSLLPSPQAHSQFQSDKQASRGHTPTGFAWAQLDSEMRAPSPAPREGSTKKPG